LPILKNHIEIVKPNNLASQTSQTIKLRCEEAARYLYPKKLAQAEPSLTANSIPMPRSTQFFMQQVLEGKILTMHPLPQQGKNSQIFQCQFTKEHHEKLYIAKIPNTSSEPCGIQREQMSNLRLAQTSDHIVRLEAMTEHQLFFENCECGDLCTFLMSATPTPENFKKFCTTIVKALIELESQGYCHSDVKPDNIFLLEGYTRVKLGDLDAVHHVSQLNFSSTLCYQAPELFTSKGTTTMATDVFSFGIIILIYMSGCFLEEYCPITSSDPVKNIVTIRTNAKIYQVGQQTLLQWLIEHDKILNKKDPERIFRRLVMACLAYYPTQRPSLKAIKKLLEETIVGFEELNIAPTSEKKRKGQQHL
jgi:serine/threonine protein kinase